MSTHSLFCNYFQSGECSSCEWIEQDYLGQLEKKEQKIRESLNFYPQFTLEKSTNSRLKGFRNRAKMVVTGSVENPVIGLLGKGELDLGRKILACPIHHDKLNQMITALPEFIKSYRLIPYGINERKGELKGIILFYSPQTNQAYLRFILRSRECVSRIKKLVPVLQKQFPEIACVSANIQPIPHAIQEGPDEIFLTESTSIDLQLGPIQIKLAPQAFVQTNIEVATELYLTAAKWIEEANPSKVLELFCGQGAFSLVAAHNAELPSSGAKNSTRVSEKFQKKFLGIEINPDAVRSANETAQRLGLTQAEFKVSDATQVAEEVEHHKDGLVLVNPPRRGLAEGVKILKQTLPKYLIYSSCSIETLARDLETLVENYSIKKAQLFDMFPHTEHFETLIWMERKS